MHQVLLELSLPDSFAASGATDDADQLGAFLAAHSPPAQLNLLVLGAQPLATPRPTNYFPGSDECQTNIGSNVKVSRNCLNVTDPTSPNGFTRGNERSAPASHRSAPRRASTASRRRYVGGICPCSSAHRRNRARRTTCSVRDGKSARAT